MFDDFVFKWTNLVTIRLFAKNRRLYFDRNSSRIVRKRGNSTLIPGRILYGPANVEKGRGLVGQDNHQPTSLENKHWVTSAPIRAWKRNYLFRKLWETSQPTDGPDSSSFCISLSILFDSKALHLSSVSIYRFLSIYLYVSLSICLSNCLPKRYPLITYLHRDSEEHHAPFLAQQPVAHI